MKKDSISRENNCSGPNLESRSVPFSEIEARKCELQGTNYVQEQISEHIFKMKWRLYVYHPLNVLRNTDLPKFDIPKFLLEHIQSRDALRPIAYEIRYLMDFNSLYLHSFSSLNVAVGPSIQFRIPTSDSLDRLLSHILANKRPLQLSAEKKTRVDRDNAVRNEK